MDFVTIETKLVGGRDGTYFNDLDTIGGRPASQNIHASSLAITKIEVASGWIVDGITITYKLSNATIVKISHGAPGGVATDLGGKEVVLAVFGRAGYQSYYKRSMINQISFLIYNTEKLSYRTIGPYGNSNGSNEGESFHVGTPLALSGFTSGSAALGLSGLSFIKAVGNLYP